MKIKLIAISAIFCYFVVYAPQPLLPVFAVDYAINIAAAGALMTATLIPLATAPLLYGYLLSSIAATLLLRIALLGLAISCILFAVSHSYPMAFTIRLLQGILLPAALTAMTTYISTHSNSDNLQKNMSLFITGTIIGGLFGRIFAGVFETYLSWETFYYLLSIVLLIISLSIPKTESDSKLTHSKLNFNSLLMAFKTARVARIYFAVFCLFFSFVAVFNYLPFMIKDELGDISEIFLGLMYSCYVMGTVTSLNAQRIIRLIGGSKKTMTIGFIVFLITIILLFITQVIITFLVLFIFCGAMFLVHSIASAEVNYRSKENKSIVNALYSTFYYGGGVLGSYFPGIVYQHYGRAALLIFLFIVSSCGLLSLATMKSE